MFDTIKKRQTPPWLPICLLVIVGVIVRVIVNDVTAYSPADEAHYVDITRWLTREGLTAYPKFVSTYLEHPSMWLSPTPLRWGYFALTTLTCSVHAPCDGRAIAWLSTIAGVASLVLTYLLGLRLVGRNAALLATALSVLSPLQLALGRRALQDEVYCASVLLAFWTLMRLFDPEVNSSSIVARRRWAGFVAASTLAFAIKEAFVFPYAAFVLLYFLAQSGQASPLKRAAFFVAPPILYCAGFVLLGRNPSALYEFVRLNEASFSSDYSVRYQSGPAHRPLFDLFLLAPIVCLSATAAVAKISERLREGGRERWLVGFLILTLTAFMGLPKNLRFVVILDPVLRLLGAWFVLHHAWFVGAKKETQAALAGLFLVLNGWVEYSLFDTVFRQRNVYDPTTYDISIALGAIPGAFLPMGSHGWALGAILAFGGAGAIVVGIWKAMMAERTEGAKTMSGMRPLGWVVLGVSGLVAAFFAGRYTAPAPPPVLPVAQPARTAEPITAIQTITEPATSATSAGVADPLGETMRLGLGALYEKKDPLGATKYFREVLSKNPTHYGATFQLAMALEQAGRREEAQPYWSKTLEMAEATRDSKTAAIARKHLGKTVMFGGFQ